MKITPHPNAPHPNPRNTEPAPDVLRFERRRATRRPISGTATAVSAPGDLAIGNRTTGLELIDMSITGMGAMSKKPIALGAVVEVVMPSHGPEHGVDIQGEIVRCEAVGDEKFSIGIALRRLAAA